MTATVKLTQSIDDREVLRAFQKQNALLDKMVGKLDQVGRKGAAAGRQTAAELRGAAGEITRFVAGFASMGAVISGIRQATEAVKREFEDMKRREAAAALVTQTAAEAVRGARINFTPDATLKDNQLEATIQQLADETRTPVGIAGGALSSALSAKGNLTNEAAVDAVRQALRLTPGNAEDATTFAGRILDVAKESEEKDARAIAGFLVNVQGSSRVTTVGQVGKTGVPAIKALTARGDTPEQAAEIFAAITQGIGDEEGRKAGTAAKNLGTRLGLFVPTLKGKDARGTFKVPQSQIDRFAGATSTSERIDVLQKSPELAREFLGSTSFDASSQAFIEKLVTGDPGAVRDLEAARANINPINKNQAALFESKVGGLDRGRFQGPLTAKQRGEAAIENFQLGSADRAASGTAREILEKTIADIDFEGIDFIARKRITSKFEAARKAGASGPTAAAQVLATQVLAPGGELGIQGATGDPALFQLINKQIDILLDLERRSAEPQKVEVVNPGGQVRAEPAAAGNNRGANR